MFDLDTVAMGAVTGAGWRTSLRRQHALKSRKGRTQANHHMSSARERGPITNVMNRRLIAWVMSRVHEKGWGSYDEF